MGKPRYNRKTVNDNRAWSHRSQKANRLPNQAEKQAEKAVAKTDDPDEESEQVPLMGEIVVIIDDHGRQHEVLLKPGGARLSCGWLGDTEIVDIVNRYSPYRDVACSICGVPYGALGVAGRGEDVLSHEIRLDSRDATCFIPRILSRADGHSWERFEKEKDRLERIAIKRIKRVLTPYRASRAAAQEQNGASA